MNKLLQNSEYKLDTGPANACCITNSIQNKFWICTLKDSLKQSILNKMAFHKGEGNMCLLWLVVHYDYDKSDPLEMLSLKKF